MIVDTNIFLARWPFRRLPLDDTAALAATLRAEGVEQAWAGSFDALLHRDVAGVNARLAEECRAIAEDLLLPIGTVNPTLPDWQEDLRRCADQHRMRGIRLHPNYHGYALDDPPVDELFALAEEAGLVVQLVVRMEDDRTQHPLVRVPDVDVRPLLPLLDAHPRLTVVLVNSLRTVRGAVLEELAQRKNAWFEIAMLEGVGGIEVLIKQVPYERVLFGSYAPFFYWESARLKLDESELGQTIRTAIEHGNAAGILEQKRIDSR